MRYSLMKKIFYLCLLSSIVALLFTVGMAMPAAAKTKTTSIATTQAQYPNNNYNGGPGYGSRCAPYCNSRTGPGPNNTIPGAGRGTGNPGTGGNTGTGGSSGGSSSSGSSGG